MRVPRASDDDRVIEALERIRVELLRMIGALEDARLELNLHGMAVRDFQSQIELMRRERLDSRKGGQRE